MGKVTQPRRGGTGQLEPTTDCWCPHAWPASLIAQPGKERLREGRFLAQGHAGDGDRGLQTSQGFRRGRPPPYALGPSNRSFARGGAHPSRCPSVSRLSGCLRGCSRAPLPRLQPRAGRHRGSQRPARAPRPQPTDGSACARAPSGRCAGAAGAKARRRPAALLLLPRSLCAKGKASPSTPPAG